MPEPKPSSSRAPRRFEPRAAPGCMRGAGSSGSTHVACARHSAIAALLISALASAVAACGDKAPATAAAPTSAPATTATTSDAAPSAAHNLGLIPLDKHGRPAPPEQEFEIEGAPLSYRQRGEFHDFGNVPLGETVEHTWVLENTDDAPIRVHKLGLSCGCVSARMRLLGADAKPLDPQPDATPDVLTAPAGARVELLMQIDTREIQVKNQHKLVHVQIVSDSKHRPFLTLEAHVIADSPLQITPDGFELGRVPASVGSRAVVEIMRVGTSWTIPDAIHGVPNGFSAQLEPREALGRHYWAIVLEAQAPIEPGPLRGAIELTTKRPRVEPKLGVDPQLDPATEWVPGLSYSLKFAGQGVPDLDVFPAQLVARGKRADGARGEVELTTLLAGHRFAVHSARVEWPAGVEVHGPALAVETLAVEPDDAARTTKWTIALVVPRAFELAQATGKVIVELEDLQYPRVEIPFLVRLD